MVATMKALAVTDVRRLDLVDIDCPNPGPDQVLVKVAWCGICGSDIPRYFDGGVHSFPQVLGHEFSGVIEETGAQVDNLHRGQRVTVAPLVPCGSCEHCLTGAPALCLHYSFIGSRQQGALAEYVAVPARNVLPIPDTLGLREAALVEPLTVALHGVARARLRLGQTALVLGGGVVGLFAALVLRAHGCRAMVCDIDPNKVTVAEKLGLVADVDAVALIEQHGAPGVVIETAGAPATQATALDLVAKKGRVVYIGTAHRDVTLAPSTFERILRGELAVTGAWMSYSAPFPGWEWTTAIDLLASGQIDARSIVTGEYSLGQREQPFLDIKDPAGLRLKLLYKISGAA
ncbi:galactitol-1-phosphate 5-dehydrogenase [Cutibacterium avidum]|uniref:galactitol-1-phosphate 5-dehydrogenase n=1 Tax=Cutibacterium avidum TaxID=33010 RepID=UPI00192C1E6B|nr:galactitol-1-phosphate 5-dehydrogenase [Cutibacterium avidum]QQY15578.1 galactitol-1-phosphate 5-dehydrogenase [Cutibacterium avidum]